MEERRGAERRGLNKAMHHTFNHAVAHVALGVVGVSMAAAGLPNVAHFLGGIGDSLGEALTEAVGLGATPPML